MGLAALVAAAIVAAAVWAAPDLRGIAEAFENVRWRWVAAAAGANLVSILSRAVAWRVVVVQALPARGELTDRRMPSRGPSSFGLELIALGETDAPRLPCAAVSLCHW